MEAFEHLLLTRFNVPLTWTHVKPDQNWLEKRIALFEKFCFPSVLRQTCQNFRWLVFFDSQSPGFLLERIKEYEKYKNFVPVFTSSFSARDCRELTRANLSKNTEYIITSQLDNDDSIVPDFMQIVQNHFTPKDMTVLNFLYGYRYYKNKLYLQRYASNSFISLIESSRKQYLMTVYSSTPHGKYGKIANLVDIRSEPGWLIVVHGDNIGNQRRGLRQPLRKLFENFPHLSSCIPANENTIECLIVIAVWSLFYKPYYWSKDLREKLKKIKRS